VPPEITPGPESVRLLGPKCRLHGPGTRVSELQGPLSRLLELSDPIVLWVPTFHAIQFPRNSISPTAKRLSSGTGQKSSNPCIARKVVEPLTGSNWTNIAATTDADNRYSDIISPSPGHRAGLRHGRHNVPDPLGAPAVPERAAFRGDRPLPRAACAIPRRIPCAT
jgi:hypothetical protein